LNLIFSVNLHEVPTIDQLEWKVFVEPTSFERVSEKEGKDAKNGKNSYYDSAKVGFAQLESLLGFLIVAFLWSHHLSAEILFTDTICLYSRVLPVNNGQSQTD